MIRILEIVDTVLLPVFWFTQIMIPLLRNVPLFPAFRRRKLDAWKEVQFARAKAMSEYKGSWVPAVVSGGDGQARTGLDLLEIMGVQAAKELALDMTMSAGPGQQQ